MTLNPTHACVLPAPALAGDPEIRLHQTHPTLYSSRPHHGHGPPTDHSGLCLLSWQRPAPWPFTQSVSPGTSPSPTPPQACRWGCLTPAVDKTLRGRGHPGLYSAPTVCCHLEVAVEAQPLTAGSWAGQVNEGRLGCPSPTPPLS